MTFESANRLMISSLSELYDEREAAAISSLIMEQLTGMPKSHRVSNRTTEFTQPQETLFQQWLEQLLQNRPVQYVLHEAWFGPYPFFVDENVLIPRPETEELAAWLLSTVPGTEPLSVLDIGTGSGCIPVYIKKKRKEFIIHALDISQLSLDVAKKNALLLNVKISFFLADILDSTQWIQIPEVDVIISNPPYIPEKQKATLEKHVRNYEPGLALFVPDADPIIFYKAIGNLSKAKLKPGGMVFLELHHDYAHDVVFWYETNGFATELKKDFSGNNRMIKAVIK